MTPVLWLCALLVCLLLVLACFFAGAEAALTAASPARLLALARGGNHRARRVNRLLETRETTIGALLIGARVSEAAAAALATAALVAAFEAAGLVYALLVVTGPIVVLAEVLPRLIAVAHPERLALVLSRPVDLAQALLRPIFALSTAVGGLILRLGGMKVAPGTPLVSALEELRGTLDLLHKEGAVEKLDRDMLDGLLDLRELTVGDVMVHRTKMFSVDLDQGPAAIVQAVLAAPYTRVPVWRGAPDNILGVIHTKTLLRALDAAGNDPAGLDLEAVAHPVWFVPDTTSLIDQLKSFRRKKMHFAVVVDEYGEMLGIVTLEDIIEEIVGEISDEHDVAVSGVRPQADGAVNVDGSVPIRDLNRAMDWALPDEEATTIAGLVIHEARTIPEAGQTFTFHGFRFQVLRKARNRITALRITPIQHQDQVPAAAR